MTIPNKDGFEDDVTLFDSSLKENFGQVANDDELEREGKLERITDELPEDFGTLKHKLGDAFKDADNYRRTRPPARIL